MGIIEKISNLFKKNREMIMYLFIGGCTTLITLIIYNILVITVLNPEKAIELQIANILSWIVAVLFAYFTNRILVFQSKEEKRLKEGSKFVLSRLVTLFLDMFVMFFFVTVLHLNDKLFKFISQILVVIGNYIISKFFVFNKKKDLSKDLKKDFKKTFLKFCMILCLTFFILIFLCAMQFNFLGNTVSTGKIFFSRVVVLFGSLLFLIILFFLYKKLVSFHLNKKKLWIIFIVLFLIFIIFQFFSLSLRVKPSWDFGTVFLGATDFVNGTSFSSIIKYLSMYPVNMATFLIEVIFFKFASIFGITNYLFVGILLNMFFIDMAIFILFLFLKKNYSMELGVFGMIFCIFLTPLFLYTPIFYSDTFSLLFPILILYLYSFIRNEKNNRTSFFYLLLLGLFTFIGMKIKATSFIIYIAILIDYFMNHDWKKTVRFLFWSFLSMFFAFSIYSILVNKVDERFHIDANLKIPMTHWVMMGMHGNGGYNVEDNVLTESKQLYDEKVLINIENIKQTLSDYGVGGYLSFLNRKMQFTWNDGTYFTINKLSRFPKNENTLLHKYLLNEKFNKGYLFFAQVVHIALIVLMAISCFYSLFKKNYERFPLFLGIFGLAIFLLIWETRSRYLFNFIPVFIACSLPVFSDYLNKPKK